MISLNEILSFFYNIEDVEFIYENKGKYFFVYKDNNYVLKEINNINNILFYTQINAFFHKIIRNRNNDLISLYNNKEYIMMYIKIKNDRKIDIQDLLILSNLNVNYMYYDNKNYYYLWNKKIENFEKYYGFDDYIVNYISGLSMNAIEYCKNIDYKNITYGFSYNRLQGKMNLFNFWDPTNLEYGPIVNTLAEYIKELFFFLNKKIDITNIFDFNFTIDDYYLLISRLVFPTYLFDSYNKENITVLVNKTTEFFKYINNIIIEIKKRYENVPIIKWLSI